MTKQLGCGRATLHVAIASPGTFAVKASQVSSTESFQSKQFNYYPVPFPSPMSGFVSNDSMLKTLSVGFPPCQRWPIRSQISIATGAVSASMSARAGAAPKIV